jgi:hypothetical protein
MIDSDIDFDYLLAAIDEFNYPDFFLVMLVKYADSTDSK